MSQRVGPGCENGIYEVTVQASDGGNTAVDTQNGNRQSRLTSTRMGPLALSATQPQERVPLTATLSDDDKAVLPPLLLGSGLGPHPVEGPTPTSRRTGRSETPTRRLRMTWASTCGRRRATTMDTAARRLRMGYRTTPFRQTPATSAPVFEDADGDPRPVNRPHRQ